MIHDPRFRWFAALLVMGGVAVWLFVRGSGEEYVGEHAARKAAAAKPEMSEDEMRVAAVRREAGAQIAKILLSQSESERATAIAVLRNLGPEALNVARELFHEMEDNRRDGSAYVLASLGTSEDKAEVAHAFVDDSANPPPLLALAAASLRDPQLVHRFLQLRTSPDPQVREAVCYGLRASSTPDMAHVLELLADGEPRVRAAAERSVTELLPKAIPASIKGVVDRALSTGEPAARVGALRLAERVSADWSVDMASRATKDANRTVRRAAVRVLADSGNVRAAPALVELVSSGENRLEKVRAASALGKVDADAASLDRLAAAARGKDPVVALAAARSLVERRDARGVPELIRLQHIKKSEELNVDSEDEDLLRGLSTKVLRQASKGTRRRGESYEKWWQRVQRNYKVPASPFVPQFPANH